MSSSVKSLWVTCGLVISLFCFGNYAGAAQEPLMRVLVLEAEKARLRSDGVKFLSLRGTGFNTKRIKGITLVVREGYVEYLIDKDRTTGEWSRLRPGFELKIRNNDPRGIWLGKRRYGGEIRITQDRNKLQVINHLRVEKYLKSVVGSEMPKSWPMAALQSQAVAARTYALQQLNNGSNYDVRATQLSQVYLGLESENARTKKAVASTRGLVLLYNRKLINAVFHSSSGGFTENSGSVWKYQFPYLVSVKDYDQNGAKFKWEEKFSDDQLAKIFNDLGGVNGIQVLKTSNTGRILKIKIYGPKGNDILTGKEFRSKLKLKSTLANPYLVPVVENISKFYKNSINEDTVFTNKEDFKAKNIPQIERQNNKNYSIPLPLIPDSYILKLKGFGAGHGVGLSQWGAKAMAEKGYNYRRILKHYYQGVNIRTYF